MLTVPEIAPNVSHQQAFGYRAFGLRIDSDIKLPEFEADGTEAEADLIVRLEQRPFQFSETQSPVVISRHQAEFYFPRAGEFRVVGGKEIIVNPCAEATPDLLRLYVEGMMIATAFYQRGFPVLHASVVQIGLRAVAFVGHVGAGKSSLAAALRARGHGVLTDDNAVIEMGECEHLVRPSFPSLKIYPAIARHLGTDIVELQLLHQEMVKRGQSVAADFPRRPAVLDRVYVLSQEAEQALTPLPPTTALVELIRNSVPTRWAHAGDGIHLAQCSRIASSVPFFQVRSFRELVELPRIAELVEEHTRKS